MRPFPPNFPFVHVTPIPTPKPIVTPVPSVTPSMTPAPTITPTPNPTQTLTPTPSISPTPLPSPSPILTPSVTPSPTVTPILTPVSTPTPTPTITPVPTVINSPTPTITPIPTVTLIPSPTATPSITPVPSPSPTVTPIPEPIGNDISYPQCGKDYPTGQLFGIVGVNGGIASTSNPCLGSQLSWAAAIQDADLNLAKIQLYVNTGNPGGLNTITWPQNNTDPQGHVTANPYGTCDGSNSIACAWQYGWNRSVDDVVSRFIPAASSVGLSSNPASYPWWLDVETTNSWRDGSSEALQANSADLEGMVAYFNSIGITPGLYSTSHQWGIIVGSLSSQSSLNRLPNWLPGAQDLIGAKSNCQKSPFTSGSDVILVQFTTNNFDYDYSCK